MNDTKKKGLKKKPHKSGSDVPKKKIPQPQEEKSTLPEAVRKKQEKLRLAEEAEKRRAEEAEKRVTGETEKQGSGEEPEKSPRKVRDHGKKQSAGKAARTEKHPKKAKNAHAEEKKRVSEETQTGSAKSDSVRRKIEAIRRKEASEASRPSSYQAREDVKAYVPPKFRKGSAEFVPSSEEKKEKNAEKADRGLRNQLRDQTTRARREQRKGKRRQNMENLRRVNKKQEFRVKKKEKIDWKRYASITGFTVLFYLIIIGTIGALYYGNLIRHAAKENDTISVRIGITGEKGAGRKNIRYGDMIRGDGMLLNMSQIAEYCDMTVTGDINSMRFYSRGDEKNVIGFTVGSRTAVINGTPVTLRLETERWGESIYVSADVFTKYASGIHVDYNETKAIVTVSRDKVEGVFSKTQYEPMRFTLRPIEKSEEIEFDSLDEELRIGIEQRYRGSQAEQEKQ